VTEAKKPELRFVRNVLLASAVVLILAFYPVYSYASGIQTLSIVCGYFISLANVLIGFGINERAFNKKVKSFMVIVFGGMAVRMVFVLLVLALLLTFSDLDTISLVSSVFFFYFLFIAIEIHSLYKKSSTKN
jgi:hypothetical protein